MFYVLQAVFDGFDVATIIGYAPMGVLVALLSGYAGTVPPTVFVATVLERIKLAV